MDVERANHAMETFAEENGIPMEIITADIESTVDFLAAYADDEMMDLLKSISCTGDLPTAAELVAYLIERLIEDPTIEDDLP